MSIIKIKEENYQPNLIVRSVRRKISLAFTLIAPVLDPHVFPIIKSLSHFKTSLTTIKPSLENIGERVVRLMIREFSGA